MTGRAFYVHRRGMVFLGRIYFDWFAETDTKF